MEKGAKQPYWVDWWDPEWPSDPKTDDMASRAFTDGKAANEFFEILVNSGYEVCLAERGNTPSGDGFYGGSLFYFRQSKAERWFYNVDAEELKKIEKNFGIEWNDGEESNRAVKYQSIEL